MIEQQVRGDIADIALGDAGFRVERNEQVQNRTEEEGDVESDKDQQDLVHFDGCNMVESRRGGPEQDVYVLNEGVSCRDLDERTLGESCS